MDFQDNFFLTLYEEHHIFLSLLILIRFNESPGYLQEASAVASVAALNRMMEIVAKVRLDGGDRNGRG